MAMTEVVRGSGATHNQGYGWTFYSRTTNTIRLSVDDEVHLGDEVRTKNIFFKISERVKVFKELSLSKISALRNKRVLFNSARALEAYLPIRDTN
jgi:hypothetical protein